MAEFTVTFLPSDSSIKVAEGSDLREAAAAAGLALQAPCGGQGRCGRCLVKGGVGLAEPTRVEHSVLGPLQLSAGWRLACQARVVGAAEVIVPPSSLMVEHRIMVEGAEREIAVEPVVKKVALQVPHPSAEDPRADLGRVLDGLTKGASPPDRLRVLRALPARLRSSVYRVTAVLHGDTLVEIEPGDTADESYGLAVDIGTTTVVAYLCHLPTGKCVAVASDLNSQAQYGDDVISRIQAANTRENGLPALLDAIIAVINDLIEGATHRAGVLPDAIYEIAVVGNTCMTHLFLGVPPAGLGTLPFVQTFRSAQTVMAADLGLAVNPAARVYVVPNIGGFVGADTVGVILASELDRSDGLRVAVDIGTNGEVVVACGGELYACSTAAGPAFEGARISQGMRAAAGAIDAVEIADDVRCHVIGEIEARGICGSGLVDAIAEMVRLGIVTGAGRMVGPGEAPSLPEKVARRLIENHNGTQFVLAWPEATYGGEAIALTARDVREAQLAKAAIYGGLELMLEETGAGPGEVEQFLLAGAFGNYIRRESALAIGLIPSLPRERIRSIGNAAGVGARLVLCSASERRRAEEIAERVKHVDLSGRRGFYDRFADAMMLRPLPADE